MSIKEKYDKIRKKCKNKSFKEILLLAIKMHSDPYDVAIGFAIGVFFSLIPSFAIGMVIALLIAWKKKFNLLATYIGTLVVNPLNSSFIFFIEYQIGKIIIGDGNNITFPLTSEIIKRTAAQLYLGALIVATISSIIAYSIVFTFITRHKEKKMTTPK